MKLLEIYEDLFQYICRLNRVARTPVHPEFARVRAELRELLAQALRVASNEVKLLEQVKRLELPLIFFVDDVISTSGLNFARRWAENRLATEQNELAGDERFFDFLEEELKDTSDEAAERLLVYYTCLGLGFRGMYQTQPDQLRQYIEQIFPRVRRWIDSDPRTRISEEAYQYADTRVLTEPSSPRIVLLGVVFVFLSLSVVAVYYGLYAHAVEQVRESVNAILVQGSK